MIDKREEILKAAAIAMSLTAQAVHAAGSAACRAGVALENVARSLVDPDSPPDPDMGVTAGFPTAGPDGPMPGVYETRPERTPYMPPVP
jgi:hypothetical protein